MADSDITKVYSISDYSGDGRQVTGWSTGTFPGPSSYTNGTGNSIDWTDLGITASDVVTCFAQCHGTSLTAGTVPTHAAVYQKTADVWKYFDGSGVEVVNATDMSTIFFQVYVLTAV